MGMLKYRKINGLKKKVRELMLPYPFVDILLQAILLLML